MNNYEADKMKNDIPTSSSAHLMSIKRIYTFIKKCEEKTG